MGIDPSRAYADAIAMLDAEREREDGAEVVAIMTPNDSHHRYAMAALDRGFDVICDKPMTNTLDEALDIVAKVQRDRARLLPDAQLHRLPHGPPGSGQWLRTASWVRSGWSRSSTCRAARPTETDPDPAGGLPWRYNPVRGGPSLVMGDIGTHAHNLVRFVSRREVTEVAAQIGHVIPERLVDDYGSAMLRFDNGARGSFWVTQTAAGVENSLGFRVSGTKGSLEWHQESPTRLTFKPLVGPVRTYTPNGPGSLPASARACRLVAGHPEGFPEAFANIYRDAAEAIAARRTGRTPDPLALWFPTERDGAIGVKFVDAAVASSKADGAWTDARLSLKERSRNLPSGR